MPAAQDAPIEKGQLISGLNTAFRPEISAADSGSWLPLTYSDLMAAEDRIAECGVRGDSARRMAESLTNRAYAAEAAISDDVEFSPRQLKDGEPIILTALVEDGVVVEVDELKIAANAGQACLCMGRVYVPLEQDRDKFKVGMLEGQRIRVKEQTGKKGDYFLYTIDLYDVSEEGNRIFEVRIRTKDGVDDKTLDRALSNGTPLAEMLNTAGGSSVQNMKVLQPGIYKIVGGEQRENTFRPGTLRWVIELEGYGLFEARGGLDSSLRNFLPEDFAATLAETDMYTHVVSVEQMDERRSTVTCMLLFAAHLPAGAQIMTGSSAAPALPAAAPKAAPKAAAPAVAEPEPEPEPEPEVEAEEVQDEEPAAAAPAKRTGGRLSALRRDQKA